MSNFSVGCAEPEYILLKPEHILNCVIIGKRGLIKGSICHPRHFGNLPMSSLFYLRRYKCKICCSKPSKHRFACSQSHAFFIHSSSLLERPTRRVSRSHTFDGFTYDSSAIGKRHLPVRHLTGFA